MPGWFEEYKESWKRTFMDKETHFFICSLLATSVAAPIIGIVVNKLIDKYMKKKEEK